jgi:lipoprotein-releasing system permease protein
VLSKVAIIVLSSIKVKLEGTFRSDSILVTDDWRMYAAGLLFAAVMGIVASVLPAWRASRVEPVDVLRGQIG